MAYTPPDDPSLEAVFADLDPDDLRRVMTQPAAFAEALLLAPPHGKPFEANYVQHEILDSSHRYNVIRVHRRAGKSWSMAVLTLFYCFTLPSCQVLIICPTQKQVAELFTTIRDFIRVNPWIHDYIKTDTRSPQTIQFANGARVNGLTTGAKQNSKALSVRGQGADIILIDEAAYLNETDWQALKPIMIGDKYRMATRGFKPKVYAASTPAYTRGVYYALCMDPDKRKLWHEVHVSLLTNPDISQEDVDEAKAQCSSDLEWTMEWLAEFPEIGEGVFPKQLVDKTKRNYRYEESLKRAHESGKIGEVPMRTIGVDWDKYNKDGHGPNILVLEAVFNRCYRVLYREEIPQSKFSLKNAVQRIIELNDLFLPAWIYIDQGYGEMQLEELQDYGKRFPHSGLAKKVLSFNFASTIEEPLPMGGTQKKRFKQAMISLIRKWMEEEKLEISAYDPIFLKDLTEYHIVGRTEHGLKFSDENEHAIDALGLAAMAMHQKVVNPYAPVPATRVYRLPLPEAVPSQMIPESRDPNLRFLGRIFPDIHKGTRSFSRKTLAASPPSERSKF